MQLLIGVIACLLSILRCAAPLEHSLLKPKAKPQRGVILIAQNDSSSFKGAAHRNIQASHSVAKCL